MTTSLADTYHFIRQPEQPVADDLAALRVPYCAMIVAQLGAILERTERSPFYPWLDTKLDLLTGADFPAEHPLLGWDLVSGWVQGRGLEAMVGFGRWLAPHAGDPAVAALRVRIARLTADLLARLRAVRAVNGGHLYFAMTPAGQAFRFDGALRRQPVALGAEAPANYSDLFTAKGMLAAAHFLGDRPALDEARSFALAVCEAALQRTFASDQPPPPAGAPAWIAGAHSHGPAMISLGTAALLVQIEPGPESVALGLRLAHHVLDGHVNLAGRWPELQAYDLVEYVDGAGQPYADAQGRIISDPGHSLEFVGLFLKFSAAVRAAGGPTPAQAAELAALERLMPALLARNFANGFQAAVGGICKTVDLRSRAPVDPTMPWWSLPETIRAALGCWRVAGTDAERDASLGILAACHNAFGEHYVRPDVHLMAVKVRGANGAPLDFIPAYPDADPGYHTALSLMDALAWLG